MSYRIKCDQCDAIAIQGVPCHETGCPKSKYLWRADVELGELRPMSQSEMLELLEIDEESESA